MNNLLNGFFQNCAAKLTKYELFTTVSEMPLQSLTSINKNKRLFRNLWVRDNPNLFTFDSFTDYFMQNYET